MPFLLLWSLLPSPLFLSLPLLRFLDFSTLLFLLLLWLDWVPLVDAVVTAVNVYVIVTTTFIVDVIMIIARSVIVVLQLVFIVLPATIAKAIIFVSGLPHVLQLSLWLTLCSLQFFFSWTHNSSAWTCEQLSFSFVHVLRLMQSNFPLLCFSV